MSESVQFQSAAVSDRGLSEKRPQNEDSYLESRRFGVFAVADGVGGAQAGEVASQMAVEILEEAFANMQAGDDPEETMRAALERANSAIFQMAQDIPQLSSMATTIAALHVAGDIATIAHVGDSRVYRVDGYGRIFRETEDHSVVEEEVRAGRMTPEQAVNHPSRNIISRALGAEETVEVDTKMMIIHPGTTFLLCSDGITRHVGDDEIAAYLAVQKDPAVVCERLKELCYERGAEDNLTAVVVRFPAGDRPLGPETIEEEPVTVATARFPAEAAAPFDRPAAPIEALDAGTEHTTSEPGLRDDSTGSMVLDPEELGLDLPEESEVYSSSSVVVPASLEADRIPESFARTAYISEDGEGIRSSAIGKIVSAAVLLIIGAVIGAGAHYLFVRSQPEPQPEVPVIMEQKSNNVPLTSFEEGRRQVDADPTGYLAANAASAQEAEDYFLLGRAFMLTGKYWEAKRAFTEAKNRLAMVDESNAKTLAAEIAIALSVIDSGPATEALERQLRPANGNGAQGNASPRP